MRLIHQSPLVDNYRKGLLVPYFGRLLSLQRLSVLRDLQDGHCCLIQRESRAFPPDSHIPILVPCLLAQSLSIYAFVAVTHLRELEMKSFVLSRFDSGQTEHKKGGGNETGRKGLTLR